MILTQVADGQGFFTNDFEKTQKYNDVFDTINAADTDLQPKMAALFNELRRINREFGRLVEEQDKRDLLP